MGKIICPVYYYLSGLTWLSVRSQLFSSTLQTPWNPSLNPGSGFPDFGEVTQKSVWRTGGWLCRHRYLPPNVTSWVWLPGPVWQERTTSCKLSSDLTVHTHTYTHKINLISLHGKSKDRIDNSMSKETKEIRGLALSTSETCCRVAEVSIELEIFEMSTNYFSNAIS